MKDCKLLHFSLEKKGPFLQKLLVLTIFSTLSRIVDNNHGYTHKFNKIKNPAINTKAIPAARTMSLLNRFPVPEPPDTSIRIRRFPERDRHDLTTLTRLGFLIQYIAFHSH